VREWVAVSIYVAALMAVAPVAVAQEEHPQQEQKTARPQESFFSGNVVSFDSDKVTVARRTLTLSWVTKTFVIDSDTKIEGTLKAKARVTVKFEKSEDSDRAIHILVRK
jgi:hypothetical protein